jgi:glyoxylate reductase
VAAIPAPGEVRLSMKLGKVYITRPIAEEAVEMIRSHADANIWPQPEVPPPHDEIVRQVRDADGLLCLLTDPIDTEVIAAARKLRVISTYAVGYDNVDVAAATARGILVCNTPGVLTETTADLAWALIMAAARRISEADRYLRAGRWQSWSPQLLLGQDVFGATLGIVGFGRIGQAVARRAQGFGMRLLYTDTAPKPDPERDVGARFVPLSDLLEESDFVSLHIPLTEQTRRLIAAPQLAMMKPTAALINTSRGAVVDQRALADALRDGRIFAAGLDVFDSEPISHDDPLLDLDNVVLLPHIGSASVATRTRMATMAAADLLAGLAGERPKNLVNPEALSS